MAVAFGRKFTFEYGEVKSISQQNDGSSRIYVDSFGETCIYDVPELSPDIRIGTKLRYMQALEKSPVRLVSLESDPHRFAHLLTAQSCTLLKIVGNLLDGEKSVTLPVEGHFRCDYGNAVDHYVDGDTERLKNAGWSDDEIANMRHPSYLAHEKEKRYVDGQWIHTFEPYEVNPILFQDDSNTDFRYWHDLRYGTRPWEMFSNVIVWETIIPTQWHPWIQMVFDFYKPAHQMYARSSWAGVVHNQNANYSNFYGAYYGGDRYTLSGGYGANYGRRDAGSNGSSQTDL